MMSEDSYSIKEMLERYFGEVKESLEEIKTQTTKTNGRVTSLENTRAKLWGAIAVLTLLGGAIITLSIIAIDTKIQRAIDTALDNRVEKVEYEN